MANGSRLVFFYRRAWPVLDPGQFSTLEGGSLFGRSPIVPQGTKDNSFLEQRL
jgi:hypothetical protein